MHIVPYSRQARSQYRTLTHIVKYSLIIIEYCQFLTKTHLFQKKTCRFIEKRTPAAGPKRRKWGLGLPKHITMLLILTNLLFRQYYLEIE